MIFDIINNKGFTIKIEGLDGFFYPRFTIGFSGSMNVSIASKQHGLEVRRLKELLVPSLVSPVLLLDLVSGLAGWLAGWLVGWLVGWMGE